MKGQSVPGSTVVTIGTAPGSAPAVAPTDKIQTTQGVLVNRNQKCCREQGRGGTRGGEQGWQRVQLQDSPAALVAVVGAAAAPGAISAVPAPAPAPRVAPGPAARDSRREQSEERSSRKREPRGVMNI